MPRPAPVIESTPPEAECAAPAPTVAPVIGNLHRRPVRSADDPPSDAEIRRQLDELRKLRRELETRERLLLDLLDEYERLAPGEPAGDQVERERPPLVRLEEVLPRREPVAVETLRQVVEPDEATVEPEPREKPQYAR